MKDFIQQIRQKATMSDLSVEEYAEKGAMADVVALSLYRKKLNPTQFRKVFQGLKTIQMKTPRSQADDDFAYKSDMLRLMPQLAYAYGRKNIPQEFFQLVTSCFSSQKIQTNGDFLRAFDFLEAVLAYHKYHDANRKN